MYSVSKGTFDDEYIRYVLDTYSDMIVKLCLSYVKNAHDAEDIAEDVFCELVKRRPVFESADHEKAWLLRAAINKCKNHLRSGQVRKTVSLDEEQLLNIAQPEEKGSEGESPVLSAVMSLPVKYRTIIHMYYYTGLSISEIAKVRKLSPSTVGTQLARGRELLRKKLGGGYHV